MTDVEALEKAIDIAVRNGWHWLGDNYVDYSTIIYDKDFARSLWGDEELIVWADDRRLETLPAYKKHLQNMVIAENPLAYLRDNLPEEENGN